MKSFLVVKVTRWTNDPSWIFHKTKQLPAHGGRTQNMPLYFSVFLIVTAASMPRDSIRMASFNVQALSGRDSDVRFEQVAKVIGDSGFPEIVALQEIADNDGDTDSPNTDAGLTLQRLLTQLRKQRGPGYRSLSVAPVANADGGPPGANIRTVVLTTLASGTNTAHVLGTGDPAFDYTRKPLVVQLALQDSTIDVIVVHLSAGPTRREKRRLQAQALARWATEAPRTKNTVLMGDFNADENEDVWPILSFAGFNDSAEVPYAPTHASGHAFDRIWATGKASLGPAHVLPRNPVSDHALVWAELRLVAPQPDSIGGCGLAHSKPQLPRTWLVLISVALLFKWRATRDPAL